MLPFSKRPPPPEEYFLRSGDFEALDSRQVAIPRAPRAPVFHRAPQAQYAYGAAPRYGYDRPTAPAPEPVAYAHPHAAQHAAHHAAMMSAPPPPHSLSPVAMGAYARSSSPTGPRSAETVVIRERPNVRWGVSILLMGALLGGALGIGMKAQKEREAWQVQQAAAAAAAELSPVAPVAAPQQVVIPPGPRQVAAAPQPIATAPQQVAAVATQAMAANVVAPTLAAPPVKSVVIPPEQAVVVAPAPVHHAKHAVASRRTKKRSHARTHHSKKTVSRKAHAKHTTHKKATHKKVAHKTHKTHKSSRGSSDAQSILQAAINNTTNTL